MALELTHELGTLLRFTAQVGMAVRGYSPSHQQQPPGSPFTAYAAEDVRWLGDCLAQCEILCAALASGDPRSVVSGCDHLSVVFAGYRDPLVAGRRGSVLTFIRQAHVVRLQDAISMFGAIRAKALAQLDNEVPPGAAAGAVSARVCI